MEVLLKIAGSFLGFSILAVIYLFIMGIYLLIKRLTPEKNFIVEGFVILLALLLSVTVRSIVFFASTEIEFPNDIVAGIQVFFYTLYSSIGGLTFEGLDGDLFNVLGGFLYYGSAILVGLVALSILTVTVSYEMNSLISFRVFQFFGGFKNRDLFIFTTATEDTYLLAKSIDQKALLREGKKPIIVFAGNELEPLDRRDPIHIDIMRHHFYYWTYAKSKSNRSVLKELGIRKSNFDHSIIEGGMMTGSRIHIFALGTDKNENGFEEKNAAIIFDEIDAILMETDWNSSKRFVIDFHVLTNCDVNYRFYEEKIEKIISTRIKELNIQPKEQINRYFQIHVVDEADLCAEDMIMQREKLMIQQYRSNGPSSFGAMKKNCFRAMVIGFGQVGQKALNEWIAHVSNLDENGNTIPVHVDVYDEQMDKIAGDYAFDHPLYRVTQGGTASDVQAVQTISSIRSNFIRQMYTVTYEEDGQTKQSFPDQHGEDELGVPQINLFKANCMGWKLGELTKQFFTESEGYDCLICALGSDSANFTLANHFIDYFKQSKTIGLPVCGDKTIFVNMRDEKNVDRIDWNNSEKEKIGSLNVIKFGCREDIYDYDFVVYEKHDEIYNYVYNMLANYDLLSDETLGDPEGNDDLKTVFAKTVKKVIDDTKQTRKTDETYYQNCAKQIRSLLEQIKINSQKSPSLRRIKRSVKLDSKQKKALKESLTFEELAFRDWLSVPLFLKRSNRSARLFSVNYLCGGYIENDFSKISGESILKLMKIEHLRWNRFYMASGWLYRKPDKVYDKKMLRNMREHDSLLSFDPCGGPILPDMTKKYDFANVMMSMYIHL